MVEIPYEGPRFSGTKASVSATSRIAELEQKVAELEKKLHGTVTTKYHDKIVAEAMQRVAELLQAPTDNDIPILDATCERFNQGEINISELVCTVWDNGFREGGK